MELTYRETLGRALADAMALDEQLAAEGIAAAARRLCASRAAA